MKKKIVILSALMIFALTGCNKTMIDTNFKYDKAIIKLANDEVVEVEIKSWCDYEGEQIQIVSKDGTVYLTNSFRCDLIKSK